MSKKTCKREKCKYYRPDWGNGDDFDYGCERFDDTSMCIRFMNDFYSVFDGYEPAEEEEKKK